MKERIQEPVRKEREGERERIEREEGNEVKSRYTKMWGLPVGGIKADAGGSLTSYTVWSILFTSIHASLLFFFLLPTPILLSAPVLDVEESVELLQRTIALDG